MLAVETQATSVVIPVLPPPADLVAIVFAYNDQTRGDLSNAFPLVSRLEAPVAVSAVLHNDMFDGFVVASWPSVPGADRYRVALAQERRIWAETIVDAPQFRWEHIYFDNIVPTWVTVQALASDGSATPGPVASSGSIFEPQ